MTYAIDANVLITSWNVHYPIKVFPTLWKSLKENRKHIAIIKLILDEIDPISGSKKLDSVILFKSAEKHNRF